MEKDCPASDIDPDLLMVFDEIARDVFGGVPKKLSDYILRPTPEYEALFEKVKNKQLSKAFSQTPQWEPLPARVDQLGILVGTLSVIIQKAPHEITDGDVNFWATFEAFRDYIRYINTGAQDSKREVLRQLTLDMTIFFCRFILDGMMLANDIRSQLAKAVDTIINKDMEINALEIVSQKKLNEKHPRRPTMTMKEAAAACGVSERTIRRWEKYRRGEGGGTKPPYWYPGRDVTVVELRKRAEEGNRQKKMAQANYRMVKNASQYIGDHDRVVDDDE